MCNCMCKKIVVTGLMVTAGYMLWKKYCAMNSCECKNKLCNIAKDARDGAEKIGREVIKDISSDMKDAASDVKTLAKDTAKDVKDFAKNMTSMDSNS